jgi:heme exporter protein B
MTALQAFFYALARDLKLALRAKAELGLIIMFFILTVGLFPIAFGAEVELLRRVAPGIFWMASLFASVLALPRLFASDVNDGSIEHWLTSGAPLPALLLGKIATHWLVTGLPLVLLAAPLSLQVNLPADAVGTLMIGLLLGTPSLALVGGLCQALALASRGGNALLALLALPLAVPSLIFGVEAVNATLGGQSAQPHLLLLAATSLVSLVLYAALASMSVRAALE